MNAPTKFRFVVVTLVLSALAPAVLAYDLGGRWWPDPSDVPNVNVPVIVDDGGIDGNGYGTPETMAAINAWNNISPNRTIFVPISGDASGINPGDGISHVIFSDPFKVCTGTCLAATFMTFDENQTGTCTGVNVTRMTDADVVFNERPGIGGGPLASSWVIATDPCSNDYVIDTVAMHEAGHMIGVLHSNDPNALMYPSVAACVNKTIDTDDEDGRNALYACDFVADAPASCGDGQTSGGEVCDPSDPGTSTAECADVLESNEYSGTATCVNDCTGYDTSGCTIICTPTETPELTCNDGQDNDCNSAVDCADDNCSNDPVCAPPPSGDGQKGDSCEVDADCASLKCRGRTGAKTCK